MAGIGPPSSNLIFTSFCFPPTPPLRLWLGCSKGCFCSCLGRVRFSFNLVGLGDALLQGLFLRLIEAELSHVCEICTRQLLGNNTVLPHSMVLNQSPLLSPVANRLRAR